uniref:Hyccin n=1 Tax=Opuntia streptacantha TaxID=393608 RepID=A0A7C8ZXD5_OPUST
MEESQAGKMVMEEHSVQHRHQHQQFNHGGSLSHTSSSSDLNCSSSSNSISISNSTHQNHSHHHAPQNQNHQWRHRQEDPMQSWWESVSKARSRVQALLALLPAEYTDSDSLSSLADSDRPACTLLDSFAAYSAVYSSLSGSGDDPLCQWLYDTFQQSSDSDSDSDLRLVVLSFVPVVAGLYLSRIHAFSTVSPAQPAPSLAGFEAVLLAIYTAETKSRAGKPLLVSIPTPAYLSQHPSLYHQPSSSPKPSSSSAGVGDGVTMGILSPPLEPQVGIKSTKRCCIVGVAFHCYYQNISQMPSWSKLDFCRFAASWAGNDCPCATSLDLQMGNADDDGDPDALDVSLSNGGDGLSTSSPSTSPRIVDHHHGEIIPSEEMGRLQIHDNRGDQATGRGDEGGRIPLPWELLQPVLRILGHCLLAPLNLNHVKDAAGVAVRRLYARAYHDLNPQAILATRSLVQIDNRARAASKAAALANPSSNGTTPRPKKPEVLLVSK